MSDESRRDYAVLRSFMSKEEAEVVACTLRAHGVDAFVGNIHHATLDWFAVLAMGGMQVLVPAARRDEAMAIMRERVRDAAEALLASGEAIEKLGRRDRWKLWVVMAIQTGIVGAFFSYLPMLAAMMAAETMRRGKGAGAARS